jgi:hypothetical protein
MDFSQVTLDPVMFGVAAALVMLGYFFKSTPDIPDWLIGYILLTLGIVAALFKVGVSVDGVVNGIIAAAMAVYGHTLFKQVVTKRVADRTGDISIPATPTMIIDPPKTEVPVPQSALAPDKVETQADPPKDQVVI